MEKFTAFEYVMIHAANAFGLDKKLFGERIEWCKRNGKNLRKLVDEAGDKPQFMRAVLEIERIKNGQKFTNMRMGLDACSSGLQILGALTCCHKTAGNVGMIDPNKRCDIYTATVDTMNQYLPEEKHIGLNPEGLSRSDIKKPVMTSVYYSKAAPKNVFGEGTIELMAFEQAMRDNAQGAINGMEDIIGSVGERTRYDWSLPDGFQVHTKTMVQVQHNIEVQELLNASGKPSTFTHVMKHEQVPDYYVAVVANTVQSVDGFLVREVNRRVQHDKKKLLQVWKAVQGCKITDRSEVVSIREVDNLLKGKQDYTESQLGMLCEVIESVMDNPVAPFCAVHDEFISLAPAMNAVRQYYIDIFAQIAESQMFQSMLRQLYQNPTLVYQKEGDGDLLAKYIRGSNYMLS